MHLELCGTQDTMKNIIFGPLLTWTAYVSNIFGVGRGPQIYKIGLAIGVAIGGDAAKSDKKTHLLVLMRVRLSQKIGLLDLTRENIYKKCAQLLQNTCNVTYTIYLLRAHKCRPHGGVSVPSYWHNESWAQKNRKFVHDRAKTGSNSNRHFSPVN